MTIWTLVALADAGDSEAADVVGPAILIVAPLVFLTFAVTGYQGWRRYQRTQQAVRFPRPSGA